MKETVINAEIMQLLESRALELGCSVDVLIENLLFNTPPVSADASRITPLAVSLSALELAADAVIAIDADQVIQIFNHGAEQIFQYEAHEVIGKPLTMLMPPQAATAHEAHVRSFAVSKDISRHMTDRSSVQGMRKDGTLFPVDVSILKYAEGKTRYKIAILRDISQQQALLNEMRERSQLLELLTTNATDLICVHEPDGKFIFVSPSSISINGYLPEELIGKNPYDYFHPEDIANIRERHDQNLSGVATTITNYRFRCKNGEYIWVETFTSPVLDETGALKNLVTITRNVTDRVNIEEALRLERDKLNVIMESSPSGITVIDKSGKITFANRRSEEILGIRKENITARTYDAPSWKHTDYDGNPWPDEKQPFVRVMTTKQPVWDVRHAIQKANGEVLYLAINAAPILDENGEVSEVIAVVEDYTARKHQQDDLEAALARERALNAMKSTFISMVSHEFRTPMAIIMTSTSILRMKRGNMSEAEYLERLERIERQITRLNDLISDVTFINKGDVVGLSVNPEPIQLRSFFNSVIEEIRSAYPDHIAVEVVHEEPDQVMHQDPSLMQQIFINLLSNAVKYSNSDSPVLCRYWCDSRAVHVIIADEGIGIPAADLPRIFEVFHRAANVGNVSGTGLGLSIVKRAVDALNGTITVESEMGAGTKFMVTLPRL